MAKMIEDEETTESKELLQTVKSDPKSRRLMDVRPSDIRPSDVSPSDVSPLDVRPSGH